jgi:GNAT superfamily N-acetyltransferase
MWRRNNTKMIEQIKDSETKKAIARKILEALHDWFEVDESREKYIADCVNWIFLAAKEDDDYVGFLCLKEAGDATVELAVMGVLKEYHRKGLGRKLFEAAKKIAGETGYSFLQVKTVKMGVYEDYDITNRFYKACGFKEFEVIKEIWGEENPCQIYVMSLR